MQNHLYAQVAQLITPYRGKEGVLVHALQDVQRALGYLPEEALYAIADVLQMTPAQVYGVATFYDRFYFQPRGRHLIRVCVGTACHVRGAEKVVGELEGALGIKAGETSPDLVYTLETVNCVGCCALAPVVMVDDRVVARREVLKVVTRLRGEEERG